MTSRGGGAASSRRRRLQPFHRFEVARIVPRRAPSASVTALPPKPPTFSRPRMMPARSGLGAREFRRRRPFGEELGAALRSPSRPPPIPVRLHIDGREKKDRLPILEARGRPWSRSASHRRAACTGARSCRRRARRRRAPAGCSVASAPIGAPSCDRSAPAARGRAWISRLLVSCVGALFSCARQRRAGSDVAEILLGVRASISASMSPASTRTALAAP